MQEEVNKIEENNVQTGNEAPSAPSAKSPKPTVAQKKKKSSYYDFRRKYYDYYDDVKDRVKGKEDW